MKRIAAFITLAVASILILGGQPAFSSVLAEWDFTKGAQGWKNNGYLQKKGSGAEGLRFVGIGVDPQLESSAAGIPSGKDLLITVRFKKDTGNTSDFYYGESFSEKKRIRFDTFPDDAWHEYTFFVSSPGPKGRFRLDPFGETGKFEISFIRVEDATPLAPSSLPLPSKKDICSKPAAKIKSGDAILSVSACAPNAFSVAVAGRETARSHDKESIGYMLDGKAAWLDLSKPVSSKISKSDGSVIAESSYADAGGVKWQVTRRFASAKTPGAFSLSVNISVNAARDVIHIPWATVFAGLGTFGEKKTQALFSGLEYLADEPSSSEADLRGEQAIRRVPSKDKVTFPLMAVVNNGAYAGIVWNNSADIAAVFDSPDRVFGSHSHLMALWGPETGALRRENATFAFRTFSIGADTPVSASFIILAGKGNDVVPAIKQYVALKGLPKIPEFPGGYQAAVRMLAGGWLDSSLHEDGLWRHAVWGSNFPAGRAADAPMFMLQLADATDDAALAGRLRSGANHGLDRLMETDPATNAPYDPKMRSGVGHVRFPSPALLFGKTFVYSDAAISEVTNLAKEFDSKGIRHYKPYPGRPDYGSTHYEDHANGFAANSIFTILNAARLYGDKKLIDEGLALLDKQTKLYSGTVPRGAQTWEIPLHTPDILASAYLVKSYTLAYALTGKKEYLEQARYWAWTGLPFVYLTPPPPGPEGIYATIAVLGATNWESPNWIGMPVQWCGLVYASALYELSDYDPAGPWLQVAKGITATGLLFSFPVESGPSQGLLPDFFHFSSQLRDGPQINPGTVQAHFAQYFNGGKLHDFKRLPKSGAFITAPCGIKVIADSTNAFKFSVDGFGTKEYHVLLAGFSKPPASITSIDGQKIEYRYDKDKRAADLICGPGATTISVKLK